MDTTWIILVICNIILLIIVRSLLKTNKELRDHIKNLLGDDIYYGKE